MGSLRRNAPPHPVPLDGFTAHVRAIPVPDVRRMMARLDAIPQADPDRDVKAAALLVAFAACDADGRREFGDDDTAAALDMPPAVLRALYRAACEVNGVGRPAPAGGPRLTFGPN